MNDATVEGTYAAYTYRLDRETVVCCNPYVDDHKHPNCRHEWNRLHPEDPVTHEEQVAYSADIPWRQP